MMYHQPSTTYANARLALIAQLEGAKRLPYYDTAVPAIPTIGIGFNLRDPQVLQSVLEAWGFNFASNSPDRKYIAKIEVSVRQQYGSNGALQDALDKLMVERAKAVGGRDRFRFVSGDAGIQEMQDAFALVVTAQENAVTRFYGPIENSYERLALLSLKYSNVLGKSLRAAINANQRAEAWYEIRFGSNSDAQHGKRRYVEAALFGLYNSSGSIGAEEAKSVYRMFTLHRESILAYESRYGGLIPAANAELQAAHITDVGVPDLAFALTAAKNALFDDLRSQNASLASLDGGNYLATDIYVDPGRSSAKEAVSVNHGGFLAAAQVDGTGQDTSKNSVLLGEGGDDSLYGGKGNDLLVGGDGRDYLLGGLGDDILIGGKGQDIYYWRTGDGHDRIIDEDGDGIIIINDELMGEIFAGNGHFMETSENSGVWKSADGMLSLTHHSPWQLIAADGSGIELGADFQDGDFGIQMHDALADPILGNPLAVDFTLWSYFAGDWRGSRRDGTSGNDHIVGTVPEDERNTPNRSGRYSVIYAGSGDDLVEVHSDAEVMYGEGGNDILVGSDGYPINTPDGQPHPWRGADYLDGGAGNDRIYANGRQETATFINASGSGQGQERFGNWLRGGSGDDQLMGDGAKDLLSGGGGDDLLMGGLGDDLLLGDVDVGTDIFGWSFTISLNGDPHTGQYTYTTTDGSVTDRVDEPLDSGDDEIYAGGGNDFIDGGAGDDVVYGESGADIIFGDAGDDSLMGGDDNDIVYGDSAGLPTNAYGDDFLDGGAGDDYLSGSGGDDTLYGGEGNDELLGDTNDVPQGDDYLDGEDGNDLLVAGGGDDVLRGGAGNDVMHGDSQNTPEDQQGDDELYGEQGDDQLKGYGGDDLLTGGVGSDVLDGGKGNDSYFFGIGDGGDTITDAQGEDTIVFGDGITPDNITVGQGVNSSGDTLLVIAYGSGNLVGIKDGAIGTVESFMFSDGSVLDYRDILARAAPVNVIGSNADDTISGTPDFTTVNGQSGNTSPGMSSADLLTGGRGNDAFIFGASAGPDKVGDFTHYSRAANPTAEQDRIKIVGGLAPNDVVVSRDQSSTTLSLRNGADSLRLLQIGADALDDSDPSALVQFDNGTTWNAADLIAKALNPTVDEDILIGGRTGDTIDGLEGDDLIIGNAGQDHLKGSDGADTLVGGNGDDILEGGTGDDILSGGTENDSYRFVSGDGSDVIERDDFDAFPVGTLPVDDSRSNVIEFADGIAPGDVLLWEQGSDLFVLYGDDTIQVSDWYQEVSNADVSSHNFTIDEIHFADGTVWDAKYVASQAVHGSAFDDDLIGIYTSDTVHGLGGDDAISGMAGDDLLYGDAGDDTLYGDGGSDWLEGGSGNDQLSGDVGDDVLIGGTGDDVMSGSAGNDTYKFAPGFGHDTIDLRSEDTVVLDGLAPADLRITRDAQNLYLTTLDGHDEIKIVFSEETGLRDAASARFVFGDGTVWQSTDEILSRITVRPATSGTDAIYGTEAGDVVAALGGDDNVSGNGGNDTLDGGEGNDALFGNAGDDVVDGDAGNDSVDGGAGQDVLRGGAGTDTLNGQDGNDQVDGGAGDDLLYGGVGDDALEGGTGDDDLWGGQGNDTYVLGHDSGHDRVHDAQYVLGDTYTSSSSRIELNTIRVEQGVLPSQLQVGRTANTPDLVLSINGSDAQLTIVDWFNQPDDQRLQVQFDDGTVWDSDALRLKTGIPDTTQGNDVVYGTGADDVITGLGGHDALMGEGGNDVLEGGPGDDALEGGQGDDVYYFDGPGFGNDVIWREAQTGPQADSTLSGSNVDRIRFGLAITPDMVSMTSTSAGLVLGVGVDSIRIANPGAVELVEFADGTVWDLRRAFSVPLIGNAGADNLGGRDSSWYGSAAFDDVLLGQAGNDQLGDIAGNNLLSGGPGSDQLTAADGDDFLDGGTGADTLSGGGGVNQYAFGWGSGGDTIDIGMQDAGRHTLMMAAGVTLADVVVTHAFDDSIVVTLKGSGDSVRIAGERETSEGVSRLFVKFADGTQWDASQVESHFAEPDTVIGGTARNDALWGTNENDTFVSSTGNDLLYGGAGDDTFRFDLGFGQDTVYDENPHIVFGAGIAPQDLAVSASLTYPDNKSTASFRLSVIGTGDSLTLVNWYNLDRTDGSIEFADGTVWDAATLLSKVTLATGNADFYLHGTVGNDTLYGFEGDDTIFGQGGDDVLVGGPGSNALLGQEGNDRLIGGPNLDSLDGGAGDDWLSGGASHDSLKGAAGDDRLEGEAGDDELYGGDGSDTLDGGAGMDSLSGDADDDQLSGGDGVDSLSGGDGSDVLSGGADADSLFGDVGDDLLSGDEGNDALYGGAGDDQLDGGAGDDHYYGGAGSDTYRFGFGAGHDTLLDGHQGSSGFDVVQMDENVLPADVTVTHEGADLVLTLSGEGDSLSIRWLPDQGFGIDEVRFGDGTTWNAAYLSGLASAETGTGNADVIYGAATADTISGGAGDDVLFGDAGDDILSGGAGDDALSGGSGDDNLDGGAGADHLDGGTGGDTYVVGLDSGHDFVAEFDPTPGVEDVLQVGPGVAPSVVLVTRDSHNLYLDLPGGFDGVTLADWFQESASQIERVRFSDGTEWDATTLESHIVVRPATDGSDYIYGSTGADTISALGGDDTLIGREGDDVLDGGEGFDMLAGGAGSDTYVFGLGYEQDTIVEQKTAPGEIDTVQFGDGILPGDVTATRSLSGDLVIDFGNETDELTIADWFVDPAARIERFVFADGTTWSDITITQVGTDDVDWIAGSDDADRILGQGGDDRLTGLGGNDELYGDAGDDVLDGGAGTDLLDGGEGVDALFAGDGNDTLRGGNEGDTLMGNDGNDLLDGQDGADWLEGGAGDDVLIGGSGSDFLVGSAGSDVYRIGLGEGDDTVLETAADEGTDRIEFGLDIAPEDVQLILRQQDLVLALSDGGEVTIGGWFGVAPDSIEEIHFVDGTIWTPSYVDDHITSAPGTSDDDFIYGTPHADQLAGLAGDDTIYGGAGDDVIDGGPGYDSLRGGVGNDVYLFGAGAGFDNVYDFDETPGNLDAIGLDPSVAPSDVTLQRDGDNLGVRIGSTNEKITVYNWFADAASRVEEIRFADGTTWGVGAIYQAVMASTPGDYTIFGTAVADNITGGPGNDSLYGLAGDDILEGGEGDDYLEGGSGQDVYRFASGDGSDTIYAFSEGSAAEDVLELTVNQNEISVTPGVNDLYITLTSSGDRLTLPGWFNDAANQLDHVLFANGSTLDAAGLEALIPPSVPTQFDDTLAGGAGDDVVDALAGNDLVIGRGGDDTLRGSSGDDTLYGMGGDDILEGGAGNDYLEGGSGQDVYRFASGDGSDTINASSESGTAEDVLELGVNANQIAVSGDSSGNLTIALTQSGDQISLTNWFYDPSARLDHVVFADGSSLSAAALEALIPLPTGTEFDDTLLGSEGNDVLEGLEGNDFLIGAGGDDALDGGPDNDLLDGGEGNDTLDGDSGNDTLFGSSGDDLLHGGAGDDRLEGMSGADTLDGGSGDDVLNGGDGDDAYVFGTGSGADTITDSLGSSGNGNLVRMLDGVTPEQVTVSMDGADLVLSLPGGQDRLTLAGWRASADQRSERVAFADGTIWDTGALLTKLFEANPPLAPVGSSGPDLLLDGPGDDEVQGLQGDDIIFGGAGNDVLHGGLGADTLYGDAGDDALDGGAGADYLAGGAGNDTYVVSSGMGSDIALDVSGAQDTIRLDEGLTFDDVVLTRDQFNLYVQLQGSSGQLAVQNWFLADSYRLEKLEFAAGTVWDVNEIERRTTPTAGTSQDDLIFGSSAGDEISGGAGNDTLYGEGGDDRLDGGTGQDVLIGGVGDDTYLVDHSSDVIYERAGEGNDVVVSSVGYELSTDIERLDLSGGNGLFGRGNAGDNVITGNALGNRLEGAQGADTLYGLGGDDILVGEAGDDILVGAEGDDTYVFGQGYGHDIVEEDGVEPGNTDTVQFTLDVAPSEVNVTRDGNDLVLGIAGTQDTLTLQDWYAGAEFHIEQVAFSDGTTWDAAQLESLAAPPTNLAPTVSASDQTLGLGAAVAAASLFSVSDPNGDVPTQYEFWDSTDRANSAAFVLDGVAQGANQSILVNADLLAQLEVQAGSVSGADQLWVRAYDGALWSDWKSFNLVSGTPQAPVVSVADASLEVGQDVPVSALFSVTDPNGDAITQYQLWDSTGSSGSATLTIEGAAQGANQNITVNADQLADTHLVGGSATGFDQFSVRAYDGQLWSEWKSFTVTTGVPQKPAVNAADATLDLSQVVTASSLFSASDPNGDTLTQYQFFDGTGRPGSASFSIDGVQQVADQNITVNADQLVDVQVIGGSITGTDQLWVRASDGQMWSDWKSFTLTTGQPQAPTVSTSDRALALDETVAAASLFAATDPNGDAITQFEFWDSTDRASSAHFAINGTPQAANQSIVVSAQALANTTLVGGFASGTDQLWVRAYDGQLWSAWQGLNVASGTPHAPEVTASGQGLSLGQSVLASSLFEVSDPDGDAISQYQLYDATDRGGSAYFSVGGVQQAANQNITLAAGDLGGVQAVGGAKTGTDQLWVRAYDGQLWSDWKSFTLTTGTPLAPSVTASDQTLDLGTVVDAASLFDVSDPNGDAIVEFQFYDSTDRSGSAHFSLDGQAQAANQNITVDADQLAEVQLVAGSTSGTDQLWVRASDGQLWSDWKSFNLVSDHPQPPSVTVSDQSLDLNQAVAAGSLFSVSDPNGDAVVQYQFYDSTSRSGSAYFSLDGQAQAANQNITVEADRLTDVQLVAGSATGSDQLWVRASDGQLWSDWKSFSLTTGTPQAPSVTASDVTLDLNEVAAVTSLFAASDPNGDDIVQYQLYDATDRAGSAFFSVAGVQQSANQNITIDEGQLGDTNLQAGTVTGTDQLWVRASDGQLWSDWKALTLTSGNPQAPIVTGSDQTVPLNATIDVAELFGAADTNGDTVSAYQFWDSNADSNSAYLTLGGVQQPANQSIDVLAAQLATAQVRSGSSASTDQLWMRASDGQLWSDWKSLNLTTSDGELLSGTPAADSLSGGAASDILQGLGGEDQLSDAAGNNLLDGGSGADELTGGSGNDLLIGGAGNDSLDAGTGSNVIAFNAGDGEDTLDTHAGATDALSLGGGIDYQDLALRKNGDDLVLDTGAGDQVALKDWYAASGNQSVTKLQVIVDVMAGFDPGSSDPLRNHKIQQFDFAALVDQFDQARAADATLTQWNLMSALLDAHLASSDTEAMGGDLAYQFGHGGTLSGVGFGPAEQVLKSSQFGSQAQALQSPASLNEGLAKLA